MEQRYKATWHLNGWGKPVLWGVWDAVSGGWAHQHGDPIIGIDQEKAERLANSFNADVNN